MPNKVKGWQDPSEHLPASNEQVVVYVEDLLTKRRYQTHALYFAKPIENDGTYQIVDNNSPNGSSDEADEYDAGWYIYDAHVQVIVSIDDAQVVIYQWQHLPANPKLL